MEKTPKEALTWEIRNLVFLYPNLSLSRSIPASLDHLSVPELESLRFQLLERIQRQSSGSGGHERTSKNEGLTL